MAFSTRRVNALFKKEIKDFGKNKNVSLMCLLPILFSFIYAQLLGDSTSKDSMSKPDILILCLGMSLSLVASMIMAMLIAEEKEKNTLRTLMLSAVSPLEFLSGKAALTFITSEVINSAIFFIVGIDALYFGKYLLITTLVLFSMIEIGALVGIMSPNQMSTGVVGMPVILILFLLPNFARLNKTLETIANCLPNYHMNVMLEKVFKGEVLGTESAKGIAVILVWIVISAAAFALVYKNRGIDK